MGGAEVTPSLYGNRTELIHEISRIGNGIVLSDIADSYDGLESDVNSLIVGGEIIANKNREVKSLVLYPRHVPFLVRLNGTVTATRGKQLISTSHSMLPEIRRGEAIQVDNEWYRVSSAIGSGAANQQNQRSTAPTSVTSDRDLSDKNVYCDVFNSHLLPLDGDFEGTSSSSGAGGVEEQKEGDKVVFTGPAFRHGCTNDVKELWSHSYEQGLKQFITDESMLERELTTLKLLSSTHATDANVTKKREKVVKKRKVSVRRATVSNNSTSFGVNAHLRGTGLERILQETRNKDLGIGQQK
eukprot:gene24841-31229_t